MGYRSATYQLLIAAMLTLVCSTSCADVTDSPSLPVDVSLTIRIPGSRTSGGQSNESGVNSLTLWFYKASGFDEHTSAAMWSYVLPQSGIFNGETDIAFSLPMDIRSGLLTGESTCIVYAMANAAIPADITDPTVARLRKLKSTTNFGSGEEPDEFLMDALDTIPLHERKLTGEIRLTRLASRITLRLNITGCEGYDPADPGRLRAWLSFGSDVASLDLDPANTGVFSHEISDNSGNGFTPSKDGSYLLSPSFYTYPAALPDDARITLRANWKNLENGSSDDYFYNIPLSGLSGRIGRNHSYDISVNLRSPGSPYPDNPTELLGQNLSVHPWNRVSFDAEADCVRYLIFGNNSSDLDNMSRFEATDRTEILLPFTSSHPVELADIIMEWDDITGSVDMSGQRTLSVKDRISTFEEYNADAASLLGVTVDNETSTLKFARGLFHLTASASGEITVHPDIKAITPFRFILHLRHCDNKTFTTTVALTQYPPIYLTRSISEEGSSHDIFVNGYGGNQTLSSEEGKGFVSVSSPDNTGDDPIYLGSISDNNTAGNRNIYTVHASRSPSDIIIIADPRSLFIDNNLSGSASADGSWTRPDTSGKMLTHYYPVMTGEGYSHFMAPVFSMASQLAEGGELTETQARRRCASYQEHGKPAGRWRIPTFTEFELLATMSARGLIPPIFGSPSGNGNTATYWTNNGAVTVNLITGELTHIPPGDTAGMKCRVRCVYDDWYWQASDCDTETFTWGDTPRDLSRTLLQ